MVPGSFTETHLTGPRAGQTSTVDALPPVSGMVSWDGRHLIAMQTTTVETHTYSNGDVDPQICHRSRVFIRLDDVIMITIGTTDADRAPCRISAPAANGIRSLARVAHGRCG